MMQRIALYTLVFIVSIAPAVAVSPSVNDKDMKSALLYHFALFTAWPESKDANFKVCTFEEDRENLNPDIFTGHQINGKPMQFEVVQNLDQIKNCHVLYIEDSKRPLERRVADQLANAPILSVADITTKDDKEAIIKIKLEDKKYRFVIDNDAAKHQNLNLSSRLLRLATKVY